MRLQILSVPVLLSLILPVTLLAEERTFEKTFTTGDGASLVLTTDVGDVHVAGTSGDQVRVVAHIQGSAKDVEEFTITADQSGTRVEVLGKTRGSSWWSLGLDDLRVRYSIEVPMKSDVKVSTAGGDVATDHVRGRVVIETSGGEIQLKDVQGDMTLETSGGNILVSEASGTMKGETSGGDIDVTNAKGTVRVETSGGDIRVSNVDGSVHAGTSGGNIIVALSGENKGVELETSGGDIDIVTAKEIRANLDAATTGGSVVCSLPVTLQGKIDESHVRGTLNGGGEVIRARTTGGDITIREGK
jgi:hypothetical protein